MGASKPVVVNIVATADLKQRIVLADVGKLPHHSYNPKVYHCVYAKSPKMHAKVSIFATGKMISIGTKSEKHAKEDLNLIADNLADAGLVGRRRLVVQTQNIVASTKLDAPLEMMRVAAEIPRVLYEPEQFPGAIYRGPVGVTMTLFASGKVIIAGATNMHQLRLAALELERIASISRKD